MGWDLSNGSCPILEKGHTTHMIKFHIHAQYIYGQTNSFKPRSRPYLVGWSETYFFQSWTNGRVNFIGTQRQKNVQKRLRQAKKKYIRVLSKKATNGYETGRHNFSIKQFWRGGRGLFIQSFGKDITTVQGGAS